MKTTSFVVAALMTVLSAAALADDSPPQVIIPTRIVDVEGVDVLPKGALFARTEARLFGGSEDLTYVGFDGRYGFGRGVEGSIRGVFASKKDLRIGPGRDIGHGGNDWELGLKVRPSDLSRISIMAGVSFADTPAQDCQYLTLGAAATHPINERMEFIVNPRAVLIDDNPIFGLGLGVSVKVRDNLSLGLEYTPILTGDNTRSTATGDLMRRDLYGAVLRYTPPGSNVDWMVGYTNATGLSTGFGLTPGLGGTGSFIFGASMRF